MIFYTALYRTMGRMMDITEVGGACKGLDGQVHAADGHRAAKQYPQNATVHFRLAAVYRRLNRLELAQEEIALFRELKYRPAER